jgi:hypothetical protein
MFPLIEKVLGKSAGSRDIHRRILSHVPAAYRPIVRMVSATFNSETPVKAHHHQRNACSIKAARHFIQANDVRCLQYCEEKFHWDFDDVYEAFSRNASVETILYLRNRDVTTTRGEFEGYICKFNRRDVFDAFPPDYQGWSKQGFIREAVYESCIWALDYFLTRLGRTAKRMKNVWAALSDWAVETEDFMDTRNVVNWAIIHKIPFPDSFPVEHLTAVIIQCDKKLRTNYSLFISLINYARGQKITRGKFLMRSVQGDGACPSTLKSAANASYVDACAAFLKPQECQCGNRVIHKGSTVNFY